MSATKASAQDTEQSEVDRLSRLYRQTRQRHWVVLVVSILVVLAALALQFRESGSLRFPWTDTSLPPMCASKLILGVECPGCGLTRSFVALAGGDVQASLGFNRVGWILALAVVAQIPYRIYVLNEMRYRVAHRHWPVWLGYLLIAALFVNWLLKSLAI